MLTLMSSVHTQLTAHTVTGSIGVRLAAAGALLAVLAGCGGEDERSAFSGCLPHVLSAVEATAAAAAHAVAAAAHSSSSSAASGVYALYYIYF
jgi:multisubunit Na+/H+ antiporter MnhG subunit